MIVMKMGNIGPNKRSRTQHTNSDLRRHPNNIFRRCIRPCITIFLSVFVEILNETFCPTVRVAQSTFSAFPTMLTDTSTTTILTNVALSVVLANMRAFAFFAVLFKFVMYTYITSAAFPTIVTTFFMFADLTAAAFYAITSATIVLTDLGTPPVAFCWFRPYCQNLSSHTSFLWVERPENFFMKFESIAIT